MLLAHNSLNTLRVKYSIQRGGFLGFEPTSSNIRTTYVKFLKPVPITIGGKTSKGCENNGKGMAGDENYYNLFLSIAIRRVKLKTVLGLMIKIDPRLTEK